MGVSRCCQRSIRGSGERPCSTKIKIPSGLRTRRISRSAARGLLIEHSTQVITTTEAAKEIELSTKQQATAVEQVNVAITNVAQASKESEVSTSQTLRTASELATLSRDLLRLVEAQRPSGVRRATEERG